MRGWSSDGYSPWTSGVTLTYDPPAPPVPTGLTEIIDGGGKPVSFEWNQDPTVTYYNVIINGPSSTLLNQWYLVGSTAISCNGTTCTITPALTFSNGAHSWTVRAFGAGGITPSNPKNFTVTILSPDVPDNLSETFTNGIPTLYEWDDDTKATWFNLYISGPSGVIHNAWYTRSGSALTCNGTTCSINPSLSYPNGNYTWYVQAVGSGGSKWSAPKPFVVNRPAPNVPTNLDVTMVNGTPTTYTWDDDVYATYFHVIITGPTSTLLNEWYLTTNPALTCAANTCALSPAINYTNGNYSWKVQAYGPGGLSAESAPDLFTINEPAPATPSNLHVTFTDGLPTSFEWDDDVNADYFSIYMTNSSGVVLNKKYARSDTELTCDGTDCVLTPSFFFNNGNHTWYVQAISPGGNVWSAPNNFIVDIDTPDVPANLNVVYTDVYPTSFEWDNDAKVVWYNVYIINSSSVVQLNAWYHRTNTDLTCDATTCSVSPNITFANGNYNWYLQALGPGGGTWSAPKNFSVNIPVPSTTSLISPANNAVVAASTVEFQWTEVNYASWYKVEFQSSTGAILSTQWFAASVCDAGTCTTNATVPSGVGKWRVQTYGAAGFGGWSSFNNLTRLQ